MATSPAQFPRAVRAVPEPLRAQRFLEETVRPATDAAVFAESLSSDGQEHLTKRMSENRKSLERLRVGLGKFVEESRAASCGARLRDLLA